MVWKSRSDRVAEMEPTLKVVRSRYRGCVEEDRRETHSGAAKSKMRSVAVLLETLGSGGSGSEQAVLSVVGLWEAMVSSG